MNEQRDQFQFAPVRYPGGIIMPTVKVDAGFTDNVLKTFQVWKIEKAEFNDGIPPGTFQLAAKAGTLVVLRGGEREKRPTPLVLEADVADLAAYLRTRADLMPEWRMNWPHGDGEAK
jgi:hypothetical protein